MSDEIDNKEALKKLKAKEYENMSLKELQWAKAYKELENEERDSNKYVPDKLGDNYGESIRGGKNLFSNWANKHDSQISRSGYQNSLKETLKDTQFQMRANQAWSNVGINTLFENADSDSGCEDDVSDWSPAQNYAKAIWGAAICSADLMRICVKGIEVNPGQGLVSQIRTYGAFGDPVSLDACNCGSCSSISFSTYSLTLKQYNLEAVICEKDRWDVGDALNDAYIDAMRKSWARWFDEQIWYELRTASAANIETLGTALSCTPSLEGSCCSDTSLMDMYNAVNNLVASMRESAYNPDYLILSPTVASIFKRMQTPTAQWAMQDVKFDADGRLSRIAGLKAIEYCGGSSCSNASGLVVAVVIDSSRACGCIFGQKPKFYSFFQSNCNSTRLDSWIFCGISELDLSAIGQVKNP